MSSKHSSVNGTFIKATNLSKVFQGHNGNTTIALENLNIEIGEKNLYQLLGQVDVGSRRSSSSWQDLRNRPAVK